MTDRYIVIDNPDKRQSSRPRPEIPRTRRPYHDGEWRLGMVVEQGAEYFFLWRGNHPHTAPMIPALRAA